MAFYPNFVLFFDTDTERKGIYREVMLSIIVFYFLKEVAVRGWSKCLGSYQLKPRICQYRILKI